MVNDFENKKILIVGLGKSGYYVAKLLCKKNEVIITDKNDDDKEKIIELNNLGVTFIKSNHQEELLDSSYDLLIRNPGVDPHNLVIVKAKELGINVTNEMEIAYHFLPENVKIVGITGSNGKTTTTSIIYEMLSKAYDNVILGGNIGYPLSEVVSLVKEGSILVLEISDHQLYDLNDFKTNISVLTNLCPTHLDFHDNYENYINVKKKIFNHHTNDDLAIINTSNEDSMKITSDISSKKLYINGNNAYIKDKYIIVNNVKYSLNEMLVKGMHNYENIMDAILVAKEFNVSDEIIKGVLSNFKGVEHRLEFVCNKDNVLYYNDSKATNPTSTKIAIDSFDRNIRLILGGFERKQDFHELDEVIKKVNKIYAIGECENRVLEYANDVKIDCICCHTLDSAMKKVIEEAKSGDVVLLSPASASWDQYKCFEDRGNEFKKYILGD